MPRKKQKNKGFSETDSIESESESTESVQADEEAVSNLESQISDLNQESPSDSGEAESKDDLLDEVRRSLIEEEALEQQKQPTLWKRVTRRLKKSKKTESQESSPEDSPQHQQAEQAVSAPPEEPTEKLVPEAEVDQLDALVDLLETTPENPSPDLAEESPQKVVEEVKVDVNLDELKKQAFQPRADADVSEELSEVRSIVLEGGEEVFVEVESKPQDSTRERMDAFQNVLRPYRQYIYFVLAFIGIIAFAISGLILFNAMRQFLPARPVEEAATLPYPVGITLPGGLSFNLSRGELDNGEWNPAGPEWLEGTELCRWVAIPWSLQMEAVVRTLNPDDSVELTMSNNDRLTYRVYAVREVSVDELPELDTDTPCLQLVLSKADSDMRWVLTALP